MQLLIWLPGASLMRDVLVSLGYVYIWYMQELSQVELVLAIQLVYVYIIYFFTCIVPEYLCKILGCDVFTIIYWSLIRSHYCTCRDLMWWHKLCWIIWKTSQKPPISRKNLKSYLHFFLFWRLLPCLNLQVFSFYRWTAQETAVVWMDLRYSEIMKAMTPYDTTIYWMLKRFIDSYP